MKTSQIPPRIGIVIPVYKHSVLVNDAIESVLAQRGGMPAITVVVNDGCPMPETARAVRTMAHAYPEKIRSLHTPNGGLSAARNRGIQWLLDQFPSLEAIFLLDADNRLDPGSFILFGHLLDHQPEADWFYPQFDMFGLVQSASHGGPWSLLMHSADNICEAGSLVRRRVFDRGVRYDENMKLGYEDWDFWLSAARHGFRGHAVDKPFFQYRKRPESMLSGSHRVDGEIRSYMRRKHAWLYNARNITAIEHAEVPRARILFADTGRILALTDPLSPIREISRESFILDTWKWLISPEEADVGAFWIATTEAAWNALGESGLLRFALWDMERRISRASMATILFQTGPPGTYSITRQATGPASHQQAAMVMMSSKVIRETLLDTSTDWIESLLRSSPAPTFTHRVITAPGIDPDITTRGIVVSHICATIMTIRGSRFRGSAAIPVRWRNFDYKGRTDAALIARSAAETGPLYPVAADPASPPSICFLLPIAEFGGVETVATNIAVAMRQRGWRTALCMVGTNTVRLANDLQSGFDEVMWFPEQALLEWGGPVYHGTHLARGAEGSTARDLLGLLAAFDAVMGCHPAGAVSILGPLRKQGVVTALHEHVMEESSWGRPYGPPMIALAHEAAVDVIATCSVVLADWLHANGVPQSKLVPVPNAPGYVLPVEDRLSLLSLRREQMNPERPLRALFIGRLDWQKGLDRLAGVMSLLRSANLDVEWRVVGKAIVEGGSADLAKLKAFAEVQRAVYTPKERSELYAWADVVVMPSRFEGLPLTVFEAQRLGAVPIMTKVGAYHEAVTDGVDGILVHQENCVKEMSDAIAFLAADREKLRVMSEAAAAREQTWDINAAPLMDRLEAEVARSRQRLSWS